jgi:hypothetical protein
MANRLVEGQATALDSQGPVLVADETRSAAVRTGLLVAESLCLLLEEGVDCALGQAGRGSSSDLLHGLQVDGGVRARFAEGTPGDDFAPLGGEVTNLLEFLR